MVSSGASHSLTICAVAAFVLQTRFVVSGLEHHRAGQRSYPHLQNHWSVGHKRGTKPLSSGKDNTIGSNSLESEIVAKELKHEAGVYASPIVTESGPGRSKKEVPTTFNASRFSVDTDHALKTTTTANHSFAVITDAPLPEKNFHHRDQTAKKEEAAHHARLDNRDTPVGEIDQVNQKESEKVLHPLDAHFIRKHFLNRLLFSSNRAQVKDLGLSAQPMNTGDESDTNKYPPSDRMDSLKANLVSKQYLLPTLPDRIPNRHPSVNGLSVNNNDIVNSLTDTDSVSVNLENRSSLSEGINKMNFHETNNNDTKARDIQGLAKEARDYVLHLFNKFATKPATVIDPPMALPSSLSPLVNEPTSSKNVSVRTSEKSKPMSKRSVHGDLHITGYLDLDQDASAIANNNYDELKSDVIEILPKSTTIDHIMGDINTEYGDYGDEGSKGGDIETLAGAKHRQDGTNYRFSSEDSPLEGKFFGSPLQPSVSAAHSTRALAADDVDDVDDVDDEDLDDMHNYGPPRLVYAVLLPRRASSIKSSKRSRGGRRRFFTRRQTGSRTDNRRSRDRARIWGILMNRPQGSQRQPLSERPRGRNLNRMQEIERRRHHRGPLETLGDEGSPHVNRMRSVLMSRAHDLSRTPLQELRHRGRKLYRIEQEITRGHQIRTPLETRWSDNR